MNNLLLFAKTPILGIVKTRLLSSGSPLGESDVLQLYSAFLKDTLKAAILSNADRIHLAFYPASSQGEMEAFLKNAGYGDDISKNRITLFPQEGASFEQRVTAAANKVLSFSGLLVIIGSDTPTMRPDLLNASFARLKQNKDSMVLGPSSEGGVYLIGTSAEGFFDFTDIFSSGCELENLTGYAKKLNYRLHVLEELSDVDVQADLLTLKAVLSALEYSKSTDSDVYFPQNTFEQINGAGWSVMRDNGDTRNKKLIVEL